MSGERWLRLQQLFDALLELPADQRDAWLARQDDPEELKQEALKLVQADARDNATVTRQFGTAVSELAPAPARGLMLGPYRLLCEIGSGGMGTVFLAERADAEFDRQVAIKLIRGIPTRDAAERLRRERQILAKLEHPHIARLLDGGTSADGQPYLVMEYVAGEPITRWCREHKATLNRRLELLRKVCLAVQYAHQRLVIHRDLKPANVLVRGDGEPALLDFGIAKLLDPNASGRQEATHAHWFTPTYAAPEQRRGEAVSTATDVYALGLLLLEMLTETVPLPNTDGLVLPAVLTRADGTRLPAELVLIIGQATHADPARRYLSPEALSEDLRRYLRGRPVLAAPDSWRYRSGKFLHRHPFAVGAVALALAVIAVSTWRLAAERDRALSAERRALSETAASQAVERYLVSLFEAADPDQSGRRALSPRELVDIGKRQLATSLTDDPAQRARLLTTLGRLYARQGLPAEAITTLDEAAALLRVAAPDSAMLVDTLEELGNARRDNHEFPRALELLGEGMQVAARLDGDGGARALRLRSEWALVLVRADRPAEAVAALNDVVARYEAAADLRGSEDHANALLFQSEALLTDNKADAANRAAQRAVTMLRVSHPPDDPVLLSALGFLANSLRAKGDFAASESVLQEMLRERLKRYEPDSEMVALVRNELAVIYHSQGRLAQAREQMQLSLASARANLGEDSLSFGVSLNNLASVLEELGDYARAEPLLRQSLAIAEKNAAEDSSAQVLARQNLGRLLMLSGRLAEARGYLAHAIPPSAEENPTLDLQRGRQHFHLGEWERRSGHRSAAATQFDAAETVFKPIVAAASPRWGQLARSRGLLAADAGDLPSAIAQLREALRIVSAARGQEYPGTAEIELELAAVLLRSDAAGEARELITRAGKTLHAQLTADAPALKTLAQLQSQVGAAAH